MCSSCMHSQLDNRSIPESLQSHYSAIRDDLANPDMIGVAGELIEYIWG